LPLSQRRQQIAVQRCGHGQQSAARADVGHVRAGPELASQAVSQEPAAADGAEHSRHHVQPHSPGASPKRRAKLTDVGKLGGVFDAVEPFTVGLEEEVMLLEPGTLDLLARGPELLERLPDDGRFKLEMPASQLELLTPPRGDVPTAIADLRAARHALLDGLAGVARPAVAGVHPFSKAEGKLNPGPRYAHMAGEYGPSARRQLVCALQVHVAVGGADRTLAVYNRLREQLPLLAALAANAPMYEGRDTGLASVRPKIAELLPRQGVPPALTGWDELEGELRWGAAAGTVPGPSSWWWELRPHLDYGTLELRVPDAQTTLADAGAIAAVAQTLVAWLAERDTDGVENDPVPTWRIEENRWSACRHGIEGEFADLRSGERRPARDRLHSLIDQLEPVAEGFGAAAHLAHARSLVERNGALRQRAVAAEAGPRGVAEWLARRFAEDVHG
jgi:carboxylate-amine ligase